MLLEEKGWSWGVIEWGGGTRMSKRRALLAPTQQTQVDRRVLQIQAQSPSLCYHVAYPGTLPML